MSNATKKGGSMGRDTVGGGPGAAAADPSVTDEHDLADELQGLDRLKGNDAANVHNQRNTQPGALDERNRPTDAPAETSRENHDPGKA